MRWRCARGPAAGASVAVLSLGLVVVLNIAVFVPKIGWADRVPAPKIAASSNAIESNRATDAVPRSIDAGLVEQAGRRAERSIGSGWRGIESAAGRRSRRYASGPGRAPSRRSRWPGFPPVCCALAIGLWAVALCCRRGRHVDDRALTGLLEELRLAMECRRPVAMRECPT